jgi:hypothetical protein
MTALVSILWCSIANLQASDLAHSRVSYSGNGAIERIAETQDVQPQPLPDELTSWYAIEFAKHHVGYAHTKLRKKDKEYEFLKHVRVIEGERPYTEVVRARLNPSMRIQSIEMALITSDAHYLVFYDRDRNSDYIDIVMPNGSRQRVVAAGVPNLELSLDLFMLRLMQGGYLSRQISSSKISLLFLRQKGAVLEEVELRNLGLKREKFVGKDVQVIKCLVKKLPPSENSYLSEFYVDKYGRIVGGSQPLAGQQAASGNILDFIKAFVAGSSQKLVQFKLVESQLEAMGDVGKRELLITHNPFNKEARMTRKNPEKVTGPPKKPDPIKPVLSPQDMNLRIAELEQMIEKMKVLKREGKEQDLKKEYSTFIDNYIELGKRTQDPDQLNRIRAAKEKAEQICGVALGIKEEAAKLYSKMIQAFQDYRFDEVDKLAKEIDALSKRTEIWGDPVYPDIVKIVQNSNNILRKSKNIIELESVPMTLTGIAYSEDVKVKNVEVVLNILGTNVKILQPVRITYASAYAIINGRLYAKGDLIKVKDGDKWRDTKLTVQAIERDRVIITYEEESKELRIKTGK